MKLSTDLLLLFLSSGHAEGAIRLLRYTRWNFKLQPEIKLLCAVYINTFLFLLLSREKFVTAA